MLVTKLELRRQMRALLAASSAHAAEKSRAIVDAIVAHPAWDQVRVLSLYSALPGEPDLEALWKADTGDRRPERGMRRRFCYPRIDAGSMSFFEVRSLGELVPAPWHSRILEPRFDPARLVEPKEIDLILVPGLAFTRDGLRLGRGGGFYDRCLAGLPAHAMKLGVCFQCQLVESLPLEAHDQRLHAVVTENGVTGRFPWNIEPG
jgi:5-formyltetrahydrofolate cyclo-ligase